MKFNSSVKIHRLIVVCVFVLMLFCNFCTTLIADDYIYHFRFDNWERVDSLADIVPSMMAHARTINGRIVAHSIVQIFELLPKAIFNVINAALYVVMYLLSFRFVERQKINNLMLVLLFSAIWLLIPSFGEVFLWLDGSINYLWAICVGLVFLREYFLKYTENKGLNPLGRLGMMLLGFVSGAFQETMAVAVFVMCVLFILLVRFYKKEKVEVYWYAILLCYIAGIIFMAVQPAESSVKGISFHYASIYRSLINMLTYFKLYALPIFVYVAALTISVLRGKDRENIILSAVFFVGFLCANGVMILATIYPGRCASPAVLLLIIADAMLLKNLFADYRIFLSCLSAIMIVSTAFWCVYGVADIVFTNIQMISNERAIIQGKLEGKMDFELPYAYASTKYSVANELTWPVTKAWGNDYMCRYFGVDSILGYDHYGQFYDYIKDIKVNP